MKNILFLIVALAITGCTEKTGFNTVTENCDGTQLFQLLKGDKTGIDFNNLMKDDPELNYWTHDGIYQGAGVAVGDLNNDGLPDVYFAGNKVADKLYLNKGKMTFDDITEKAGIKGLKTWSAGVTMADVNSDGWLDIYVCKFLLDTRLARKNLLFINNGLNDAGEVTFTEKAEEMGIADEGYSISGNFFDYDKDGDLDLYVANQPPNSRTYKDLFKKTRKRDLKYTDRFYKNNGDGTFKEVTKEVGIEIYTYSLSATVGDLNKDGWPDVYVACDYEEPDHFFQNNGDGTFTNVAHDQIRHMSNFSMGADIGDIDNDGWQDIYTVDMVAKDNYRQKTNMSGMNPEKFYQLANNGFHYQYMFNALQLNNGNETFSEIAQMSGVSNTDWSWAPLFADFDNDGFNDLMVTNGLVKDVRNKDYINQIKAMGKEKKEDGTNPNAQKASLNSMDLIKIAPSEKISNFMYKNNGDLTFADKTKDWGFDEKGFSQGAAYADLDLDGDLDIVVNNMNSEASIYKNLSANCSGNNFLRVETVGDGKNINGIGATVEIFIGGKMQLKEVSPVRGYMSTSEKSLHFGLGNATVIDKVKVTWLNGKVQELTNVEANSILVLKEKDATGSATYANSDSVLFDDITAKSGLNHKHSENEYDDFKNEVLLPHRMSRLGPCLAKADVNGDGAEDVFIGGPTGQGGALYFGTKSGSFQKTGQAAFDSDSKYEDIDALFFDADGDGDSDLYVVSGGNEFPENSPNFQDRLYLNDGGQFTKSNALPKINISGGTVAAGDFDKDGDLDLFVGGRQVPGKYGFKPLSQLLQNDGGKFKDVTEEFAPELSNPGMVTDALWTDFDKDGDEDLLVVGEWMAISVYENYGGSLKKSNPDGLQNSAGWWNRIIAADIDNDGDEDFICGNLGLNIKFKASPEKPFKLYSKDFDNNGTNDVYLGYYDDDGVCYPVRGRQCSSQEMPFVSEKFKTYADFAVASIDDVLDGKTEGSNYLETQIFESSYIENLGNGDFKIVKLPIETQIAPVFGIAVHDWNNDGNKDLLVAGNFYEREVETTRSDAGTGQILLGDGKGGFEVLRSHKTGLRAVYDVRAVELIQTGSGKPVILVANNNSGIQVYAENSEADLTL